MGARFGSTSHRSRRCSAIRKIAEFGSGGNPDRQRARGNLRCAITQLRPAGGIWTSLVVSLLADGVIPDEFRRL